MFDVIKIRIFDQQRSFRKEVRTNIFLSSSEQLEFNEMPILVDKMYSLYGSDDDGDGEVEYLERETFDLLGMFLAGAGLLIMHTVCGIRILKQKKFLMK